MDETFGDKLALLAPLQREAGQQPDKFLVRERQDFFEVLPQLLRGKW